MNQLQKTMKIHKRPIGPSIHSLLTASDYAKRNFKLSPSSPFVLEIWSKAHRVRVRGAQLENTRTRTAGMVPGSTATATFCPSAPPKPAIRLR